MLYYDPWSHAIKIFFMRLMQFILASVLLGLLAWQALLRWYLGVAFMEATRLAIDGGSIAVRAMLGLCLIIGALMTAWLFTWLMMRRTSYNDRHPGGAQIIYRDNE